MNNREHGEGIAAKSARRVYYAYHNYVPFIVANCTHLIGRPVCRAE